MTELVPDHLQRKLGIDQPLGTAVSERMRAGSRDVDPGLSQDARGPIGDDARRDGALRRHRAQEEMAIGTLRPTVLQVVDQPLPNLHRQG
jgi:hypothetical protein